MFRQFTFVERGLSLEDTSMSSLPETLTLPRQTMLMQESSISKGKLDGLTNLLHSTYVVNNLNIILDVY